MSLVRQTPRERILTETDGPFVSVSNRPARPWDVSIVLAALAQDWDCSAEQAQRIVHENFARVLRSGGSVESIGAAPPGA